MTRVIGVRFRRAGKVYFFAPGKYKIRTGDKVIVETARGVEFGSVVTGPKEVEDDKILQPLKPVIRIATADDIRREEKMAAAARHSRIEEEVISRYRIPRSVVKVSEESD